MDYERRTITQADGNVQKVYGYFARGIVRLSEYMLDGCLRKENTRQNNYLHHSNRFIYKPDIPPKLHTHQEKLVYFVDLLHIAVGLCYRTSIRLHVERMTILRSDTRK